LPPSASGKYKKTGCELRTKREEDRIQLEANWIKAARTTLDRNLSTFAVLPLRELVATDGYVAKLAELGYEVEGQCLTKEGIS
jgi:hypothetical protein